MIPQLVLTAALCLVACYLFLRVRRSSKRIGNLTGEIGELKQRVSFDTAAPNLGNEDLLTHEWTKLAARFHRHGDPFAVVIMEVRHASEPDIPLAEPLAAQAAQILLATARAEDTVCRLDERTFAALLATTEFDGALRFVDRARGALSSEPVATAKGHSYLVMVAGVAEWQSGMTDITDLLEAAAKHMEYERRTIASQQSWVRDAKRRSA